MALSDEERNGSEQSDSEDDDVPYDLQLGTKREFTVGEEDRRFLQFLNSANLVTRRVPYLIVRTRSGVLAAGMIFQLRYFDEWGVTWAGASLGRVAATALFPARSETAQIGDPYECRNADGDGTVTIYSRVPLEGQYWVCELLGIQENAHAPCYRANESIPRCVRQLKVTTLEEMARYLNTDPLSVLAYFGRTEIPNIYLKGNVGHAFLKSLGNPSESVYVSPMSRSEVEGATLLRIDDDDYSLVSGKRVKYEMVRDVFHVQEEGGSLRRIDDDALVG